VEQIDDPQLGQLMAEMAWLRRLARALLRADDADDVAHDAWLVAAERQAPDDRPLRPWLGRVVLNLVRMQARARKRREAREAAGAELAEAAPRPDELVQRVELQRLVAGEVLQLAEPYRSTVLLHYFEELSCAEIARRLALPEGTVRRRLKVALDELRARIAAKERRSGGLAVLAPLGGLAPTPSPAVATVFGVIAMKKLLAAVAVLILLIVAAVVWKTRDDERDATSPATAARTGAAAASAGAFSPGANPQMPAWMIQRDAKPRRIAGRVTFRGAPVAGATVELASIASEAGLMTAPRRTTNAAGAFDFGEQAASEWSVRASAPGNTSAIHDVDLRDPTTRPAPDRLELELGACDAALFGTIRDASGGPIASARVVRLSADMPKSVPGGPAVISDDDGAYELCLDSRWTGPVRWSIVEVSAAGYAAVTYRSIVPGRVNVDFALVPEATISGRVVRDDTGEPVPGAYVFAAAWQRGVEGTPQRAAFTDQAGRFRLDQIAAGRHLVFVRADGLVDTSPGTSVDVGVGQASIEIEIRLEAASTLRGGVVDGDRPIAGARVVAADSRGVGPSAVSQEDGSFVLVGVPRGDVRFTAFPYEVVKPERFAVTRGEHDGITIEVDPRGAIVGRVVRGERPVPGANLAIHGPNDGDLGEVRTDGDGRFEARGLRPGPWTVAASDDRLGAFGTAPETVHLARGETKEVTIDLAYAASIAGRVVDQHGEPVAGVTVVFRSTKSDDGGIGATSADGTYRATMMTGGGPYRPAVRRGMPSSVELRPVTGAAFPLVALADGSSEVTGVVLAVQLDRLSISGKVVDGDGAPVPDVRVLAEMIAGTQPPRFAGWLQHPAATTDVDGRFSIDDLLAGTYALRARSASGVDATLAGVPAGGAGVTLVVPTPGAIEVTTVGFKTAPQVTAIRSDRIGAHVPTFGTGRGTQYAFRDLAPGRYVVSALSGAEAATAVADVASGRTSRVTLASGGSGVVAGRVRDFRSGRPVEGMTCHAIPRRGLEAVPAPPREGARTDARGAFLLDAAAAGEIAIWCDGLWRSYANGLRLLTLQASQRVDLDVPVVAWSDEPGITLGGLGADFDFRVLVPRLVAVAPGGPAATAGFRDGDVVVEVDGSAVTELSPRGVRVLIVNRPPGTRIRLGALRDGKPVSGEVVLGAAR
jgi:RNA polymerase sigma factor (sigma-70 family)